jgi:hypothetical protein
MPLEFNYYLLNWFAGTSNKTKSVMRIFIVIIAASIVVACSDADDDRAPKVLVPHQSHRSPGL